MHLDRQLGRGAAVIPFPYNSPIRRQLNANTYAKLITAMAAIIARHVVASLALYAAAMHPEMLWEISQNFDNE